ncbi:MAG: A24 family peptidase [Eubacteriales bacterium]|nr:A24 family peptidase [Eubacteriales bacterium]
MENAYELSLTIVKTLAAILAGVLLGNGIVYFFNKIPAEWMTEYGEEPPAEMKDPGIQRLKGYPARYLFTMIFVSAAVWLVIRDVRSAVPILAALWLLTEIAVSDAKYRIIPDQWVILLAVTTIGFLGKYLGWKDCLYGILAGTALIGSVALVGRICYRKMAVGMGDIKLFAVLGALTGFQGILFIFVLSTLLSAAHYVYLLASGKRKKGAAVPYAPYAAIACWAYWLFFWDKLSVLTLKL